MEVTFEDVRNFHGQTVFRWNYVYVYVGGLTTLVTPCSHLTTSTDFSLRCPVGIFTRFHKFANILTLLMSYILTTLFVVYRSCTLPRIGEICLWEPRRRMLL